MRQRLSWKEIQTKYPDQWVGLTEVVWIDDANVESAVVKYADKSSSELLWLQENEEELVSFYTTPDHVLQMGLVGLAG